MRPVEMAAAFHRPPWPAQFTRPRACNASHVVGAACLALNKSTCAFWRMGCLTASTSRLAACVGAALAPQFVRQAGRPGQQAGPMLSPAARPMLVYSTAQFDSQIQRVLAVTATVQRLTKPAALNPALPESSIPLRGGCLQGSFKRPAPGARGALPAQLAVAALRVFERACDRSQLSTRGVEV